MKSHHGRSVARKSSSVGGLTSLPPSSSAEASGSSADAVGLGTTLGVLLVQVIYNSLILAGVPSHGNGPPSVSSSSVSAFRP